MHSEYSLKKREKKTKKRKNNPQKTTKNPKHPSKPKIVFPSRETVFCFIKSKTEPISLANQNKILLGSERLCYCAVQNIRDWLGSTATSPKLSSRSHSPSPALMSASVATAEVSHSYQCTTNSSQTWHMPACSPSKAGITALPLINLGILMMRGSQNPDITLAGTSWHWIWFLH